MSNEGTNFEKIELGALENLHTYELKHPALPKPIYGKVFLNAMLHLTGMEVSVNKLAAGAEVPFYHKHRTHEELYFFVRGAGQFQVDGQTIEVREGTALRVAPDGVRTWRNNSKEDLYYVVVQAKVNSMADGPKGDGILVREPVTWP
jgi:mannose-6-phosphate isomerase-like protein (cupin superfamily)